MERRSWEPGDGFNRRERWNKLLKYYREGGYIWRTKFEGYNSTANYHFFGEMGLYEMTNLPELWVVKPDEDGAVETLIWTCLWSVG